MVLKRIIMLFAGLCLSGLHAAADGNGAQTVLDSPELKIADFSPITYKQQGPDCGYHAVKNAVGLYRYAQTGKQEALNLLQNEGIGPFKDMPACRVAVRGTQALAYLDSDEVKKFAEIVQFPAQLTVMERVSKDQLQQFDLKEKRNFADIIFNIREQKPFTHAFILGNMKEIETAEGIRGTQGHYIAAVVKKESGQPLTFYFADSSQGQRQDVNVNIVFDLQTLLQETANPFQLLFGTIEFLINEAERNIGNEQYAAALHNIEEAVLTLKEINYHEYFATTYQQRILQILDLVEEQLPEETGRILDVRIALTTPEALSKFKAPSVVQAAQPAASTAALESSQAAASRPEARSQQRTTPAARRTGTVQRARPGTSAAATKTYNWARLKQIAQRKFRQPRAGLTEDQVQAAHQAARAGNKNAKIIEKYLAKAPTSR